MRGQQLLSVEEEATVFLQFKHSGPVGQEQQVSEPRAMDAHEDV